MTAHASSPPLLDHFIGGAFRTSDADGAALDINPSDATVIARVPAGADVEVRLAVDAAASAFETWRALSGPARAEHLYRWAAAIDARRDALARVVMQEVGKPIGEARGEVGRCITILRYYAGEAVRTNGEVIPAQAAAALQFTLREPLGVVALITPWNFPIAIPLWKAAPALAFGNTVVLKPAESASFVAATLAETARDAELPAGVFNVVLGRGSVIGPALLRSEAVRAVSFTGSEQTGALVAAIAAERNIRYQTEMGGKNVVIVAPDADLDLAASLTAAGAMRYAGQKCTATSRAVVHDRVADAFIEKVRAQVEALPLGPVDEPSSAVGPLIDAQSQARIKSALAHADAAIVCGGDAPSDPRLANGFYITPAIVRDVSPDSALARDELFGPVLAVMTARDIDEAIGLANRTRYGLSASLFTRDIRSALGYIRRIEVGLVRVNGDTTGVDPHAPFGGMKGSSSGSREQGPAAREFYTEIKTVQINP
jgi:alpha-ketoglutaric semialdehyde dehydrogenase